MQDQDEMKIYFYATLLLVFLNMYLMRYLMVIESKVKALEDEMSRQHQRNFGLSWA